MTLATRCPSCVTVFKVVPDQLRVSDGWVRCGRCNEVFNALDHLVDLAAPPVAAPAPAVTAPPRFPSPPSEPTAASAQHIADASAARTPWAFGAAEDHARTAFDPGPEPAQASSSPDMDPLSEALPGPGRTAGWAPPSPDDAPAGDIVLDDDERRFVGSNVESSSDVQALQGRAIDPPDDTATWAARAAPVPDDTLDTPRDVVPDPDVGDAPQESPAPSMAAPATTPVGAPAAEASPAPEPVPQFLREAERAARWQRPRVRRALMAGCAAAGLLLVAQVGLEYRDLLAARWPALQPPLEAACRLAGCRIEPPRWIEAVAVDSSGLVRVEGTSTYRFSVVLANRAGFALALPSIDLTLTDVRGQVVARRMLRPLDLGHDGDRLEPGTELPLRATLAVSERVVAGYTIEIYYP